MRFEVVCHPGQPCGTRADGSFCYTRDGAHFTVPAAPDPSQGDLEPPDWVGWQDLGYVAEDTPPWAEMLAYRRRAAALIPGGGRTCCPRCRMPWGDHGNRRFHPIWYSARHAISVTCEWCWQQLTVAQRILFAAGVVFGIWREAQISPDGFVADWPAIERAILGEAAGIVAR